MNPVQTGALYTSSRGVLRVAPYFFEYKTFTKQRWLGKRLIEVFEKEFCDRPMDYYKFQIIKGNILVNKQKVAPEYTLCNSDLITHSIHRHEPPVTDESIQILHLDDQMVVVNKPASLPVHPSGRYNMISLVEILKHKIGLSHLSLINRIDRLVSGIVLMATTPESASILHDQMLSHSLVKEYVCKVKGKFPTEAVCEQPIMNVEHKLGLHYVSSEGKQAKTTFQLLSYDGEFSIVYCRPFTGRSHQIRIHLQYLGFPIVNDPLYQSMEPVDREYIVSLADSILKDQIEMLSSGGDHVFCEDCQDFVLNSNNLENPIMLHAFRYSLPEEWSFETEKPSWIDQNIVLENANELIPKAWFT